MSAGQPGAAIVGAWPTLGDADPRWRALVDEVTAAAARLRPSVGAAALIHPDAAAAAVVDRRGRLRGADARFRDRIGEPAFSADCRRLVARAATGASAIGLVTALDGRVAPIFAKRFAADGPWASLAAGLGAPSSPGDSVLLIAFAPLQASALGRRASGALGLSPLEATVAEALLDAPNLAVAADAIGVSRETAKETLARAMRKAGARRAPDLVRRLLDLTLEAGRERGEARPDQPGAQERLRVIMADGRRVAFIDYGPAGGAPLLVGHGFHTGRLMPEPLLVRCQAAGLRVIIPQRPGFGLTDPAVGDYLEAASGDLAAILDSLGYGEARALYRDGGVATLIALAQRYPGRLQRAVLVNPRPPRWARAPPTGPISAISRLLLDRPALIEPFAEMLRRQTRTDALAAMLRRACQDCEADRRLIADEAVLRHLVRDAQGLLARPVTGFVDEQRVYASGWSPPQLQPGCAWRLAWSGALAAVAPDLRPWSGLPNLEARPIEGAGMLFAFSHPAAVVSLVA